MGISKIALKNYLEILYFLNGKKIMNFKIFLTLYYSKVTIINCLKRSFSNIFVGSTQVCAQLVLHDYWKCKNYIV